MPERYQFICGYLKANEKKLFTEDTRRRIEASHTIDELFRAVVDTHFQPLIETGTHDEQLLYEAEKTAGSFSANTYSLEGAQAVFYALIPNLIESIKLIWLGADDRLTSSGFTLEKIRKPVGLPEVISENISMTYERIMQAETMHQLEHFSLIEKRRLMNKVASQIGAGLEKLNHELIKVEDAFLFYWFLFRNPDYFSAEEKMYLEPHLTEEFRPLSRDDIEADALENCNVFIRAKDPTLADTCLLFMKTELKDALVLKHELEASIIKRFPIMEVGPFYPVHYFLRLKRDLQLLKSNILRILGAQERSRSAA